MTRDVAILAFDQMEVLDFAGPFAVLTTCNRVAERRGEATPFSVTSVADTPRVRARAGMTIVVDHQLRDVPHVDVVVVPAPGRATGLGRTGPSDRPSDGLRLATMNVATPGAVSEKMDP